MPAPVSLAYIKAKNAVDASSPWIVLYKVDIGARSPCLLFSGKTGMEYVEVADIDDFAGTASFSVECWFKPTGIATTYWPRILSKEQVTGVRNGWALYHVKDDGRVAFVRIVDGTELGVTSSVALTVGQWYHLAGTYDGATIRLYVDAVEQFWGATDARSLPGNAHPLTMGAIAELENGAHYSTLIGALDEVRIWNYARTQSQILADKGRRLLGTENGLVNYWPADDNLGALLRDASSAGNHGIIVGAEWSTRETVEGYLALTNHPSPVVYGGVEYDPFPIAYEIIEQSQDGRMPQLVVHVANVDRQVQAFLEHYDGLRGQEVTIAIVNKDDLAAGATSSVFTVQSVVAGPEACSFVLSRGVTLRTKFPGRAVTRTLFPALTG